MRRKLRRHEQVRYCRSILRAKKATLSSYIEDIWEVDERVYGKWKPGRIEVKNFEAGKENSTKFLKRLGDDSSDYEEEYYVW